MTKEACQAYGEYTTPLNILLSELEDIGNHIEIIHFPRVDIIVNKDATSSKRSDCLVGAFHDGIPEDWETIDDENTHVFSGKIENRVFIAKRRSWVGGSKDLARIKEYREKGFTVPRHLYALNSVLNELALSPLIKRLLMCEEAQEAVQKLGFSGIDYVEPIIAFIEKDSGQKGAAYQYIDESDVHNFSAQQWSEVVEMVKGLLKDYGIRPIDLRSKDILIDNERKLHLIDTEAFYSNA